MKRALCVCLLPCLLALSGCATLLTRSTVPISLSFSDGGTGRCLFENSRGRWEVSVPGEVRVRKDDEELHYKCQRADDTTPSGEIDYDYSMAGALAATNILVELISESVDTISGKGYVYPREFVIPVPE